MLHNLFYFPQHAVYFKIVPFSVQTILKYFIKHRYNLNTYPGR
jgi:hypothetical protein